MTPGIVSLVIIGIGAHGHWIESRSHCLVLAQTTTGRSHLEDLYDLCPQAAGKLPTAPNSVLSGDVALFMGGRGAADPAD